ncbi:MAG: KH domain-containing protein [Spirochaetaceae bacterium]|nr:KH domain-containing protein [Spirochaetaceae bacterium]
MEKELIEFLAKSLVTDPDAVRVEVIEKAQATVIELSVSDGDLGRIIGKQGGVARAIRVVLQAAAAKNGKRAVLEILG